MIEAPAVTYRPAHHRALFLGGLTAIALAALAIAGVGAGVAHGTGWRMSGPAAGAAAVTAALLAVAGLLTLRAAAPAVRADAHGLCHRQLSRNRSVPWPEVAVLRVHRPYPHSRRPGRSRLSVVLRDGGEHFLPLPPPSWRGVTPANDPSGEGEFEARVGALRALHRRYGSPDPDLPSLVVPETVPYSTVPFISALVGCLLLVLGLGTAVLGIPQALAYERAWNPPVLCAAGTPVENRLDCLVVVTGVIEGIEATGERKPAWLFFTDGGPTVDIYVSYETARSFREGDRVDVTYWRGAVEQVAGEHARWREEAMYPGALAALLAGFWLAACYPVAQIVVRVRVRRTPGAVALPLALPFAGVLVATALWLLPLCVLRRPYPLGSPTTVAWAIAGTVVTAGLLVLAFRATRPVPPGDTAERHRADAGADAGDGNGVAAEDGREDVFLPAYFVDSVDFDPYHSTTHLVLGPDGSLAVSPHPGPGRFGVRRIPTERLTVLRVRRVQAGEAKRGFPISWQVADLDYQGELVRLRASRTTLDRVLRPLRHTSATFAAAPGAPARTPPPS
ncbi:PH domain-containing protein [Streptomyces sp. NPDC060198]|uniref:PH domain-containing protein n=1 Tax=Streptomyces sp. NPDC060198 TaxID=3347070 RepID=UPI00364B5BD9